jgi:hypothetical protein
VKPRELSAAELEKELIQLAGEMIAMADRPISERPRLQAFALSIGCPADVCAELAYAEFTHRAR